MFPQLGILAFGLPGGPEWIMIFVVGLLLFGRRLPEVGRAAGRTLMQFRRGFEEFKRQLDSDDSLRDAKDSVRELKRAVDAPRIATDPRRLIKKLTDDVIEAPLPEDQPKPRSNPDEPTPESSGDQSS